MANNNDYGYFGKGTEGYAHYKQAFDRNFGQGKKPSGGGGNFDHGSGCLAALLYVLIFLVIGACLK